jgi:hypothetical protein
MPEEPVTIDELERLLLQLMGTSPEELEQQLRSRLREYTLVGGKRVARQESRGKNCPNCPRMPSLPSTGSR